MGVRARWGLLALVVLSACRDTPATAPACTDDDACAEDEWCNSASRCQRRPGCNDNQDCDANSLCDPASGLCLPAGQCGSDLHCPTGSVCVASEASCVPGCRGDGDCSNYQLCDVSEADVHPQDLGACVEGCRSNEGCPLGARCVGGRCHESPNESHCAPCNEGVDCPSQADWCLINPAYDRSRPETGGEFQCAVDCAGRPEICPNGYECADVVRLTDDPCTSTEDCPNTRQCVLGEGQSRGFCGCAADADCSYERVPPTCTLAGCLYPAGRLCGEAADCEPVARCADHDGTGTNVCYRNRQITCETFEDCLCVGGRCVRSNRVCERGADCNPTCVQNRCRIGQACAPQEGLYCSDLP